MGQKRENMSTQSWLSMLMSACLILAIYISAWKSKVKAMIDKLKQTKCRSLTSMGINEVPYSLPMMLDVRWIFANSWLLRELGATMIQNVYYSHGNEGSDSDSEDSSSTRNRTTPEERPGTAATTTYLQESSNQSTEPNTEPDVKDEQKGKPMHSTKIKTEYGSVRDSVIKYASSTGQQNRESVIVSPRTSPYVKPRTWEGLLGTSWSENTRPSTSANFPGESDLQSCKDETGYGATQEGFGIRLLDSKALEKGLELNVSVPPLPDHERNRTEKRCSTGPLHRNESSASMTYGAVGPNIQTEKVPTFLGSSANQSPNDLSGADLVSKIPESHVTQSDRNASPGNKADSKTRAPKRPHRQSMPGPSSKLPRMKYSEPKRKPDKSTAGIQSDFSESCVTSSSDVNLKGQTHSSGNPVHSRNPLLTSLLDKIDQSSTSDGQFTNLFVFTSDQKEQTPSPENIPLVDLTQDSPQSNTMDPEQTDNSGFVLSDTNTENATNVSLESTSNIGVPLQCSVGTSNQSPGAVSEAPSPGSPPDRCSENSELANEFTSDLPRFQQKQKIASDETPDQSERCSYSQRSQTFSFKKGVCQESKQCSKGGSVSESSNSTAGSLVTNECPSLYFRPAELSEPPVVPSYSGYSLKSYGSPSRENESKGRRLPDSTVDCSGTEGSDLSNSGRNTLNEPSGQTAQVLRRPPTGPTKDIKNNESSTKDYETLDPPRNEEGKAQ